MGEIAISTIDAFCLSLLREFPLEADLDPGFGMTDETEAPRLVQQALDRTLAVCGAVAVDDPAVAMVLARLGAGRVRTALAHLLERRLVAPAALQRFLVSGPPGLTGEGACRQAADRPRPAPGGASKAVSNGFSRTVRPPTPGSGPWRGSSPASPRGPSRSRTRCVRCSTGSASTF